MSEQRIKIFLFGRMERVYGAPRNRDGLAAELARHLPTGASDDALEALAARIVQTRKAKGFPSAAELISAVRAIPVEAARAVGASGNQIELERRRDAAVRAHRGSAIAHRAVSEGWAPALVSFLREHLRAPDDHEIAECIAIGRRNDQIARESSAVIQNMRAAMHTAAVRDLGLAPLAKQSAA